MTTEGTERRGRFRRPFRRDFRLWPGGIAGRVAIIIVLGLIAIIVAHEAFDWSERRTAFVNRTAQQAADRLIAIVELVEATPAAERPRLLRALNGPLLQVQFLPAPPPRVGEERRFEQRIRRHLSRLLEPLGDRPVEIQVLAGWRDSLDDVMPPPTHDLPRWRGGVLVSVGEADGSWLVFTARHDRPIRRGWPALIWLAAMVGLIVLISIWAAHRLTRPLRRFTEAADRLGLDVRATPLPEHGSRELRRATRAFNRMQERLRRFVDDRTLMLAAISHDLRTMLTRLRLRAEFIEDDEQQRKALADLDEMQSMLDATLSFARDDAAEEARTRFDIASLLQSLCDDLADTGQAVTYDGPDRLTFEGRPTALRRAFGNLIDNAVRYGHEAKVGLIGHDDRVEVTVSDRGPGIPAEMREKVFTPFFRLEGSRSRETGGTGLGLAVVRAIARRHGGDVTLGDAHGGGLLARVVLPVSGT